MREQWVTKIGLILALAGNAIGLGNFLRFPVQATQNGGGAFMIPYFFALVFMGIPLMWVEMAIGRLGGRHGHGHTAGMLEILWPHPLAKYLGAIGLFIPFTIALYYTYVESWCLAYSFFSATGHYFGLSSREAMGAFLKGFQGVERNQYFSSLAPAYGFYLLTLGVNLYVLYRGVASGLEYLAKIALPLLFLFGVVLVARVLTLGAPDTAHPDWNISAGLGFVWNPRFDQLGNSAIWLAAAGQIFFTLSIGWGIIEAYASYMKPDDDVALTGLSTATLNEFAEVVLGGTIAIPAAVAFFGFAETHNIAAGGAFDLGFQALPVIFQKIPVGQLFGALWFLLLFFAGITSSVAMGQPVMALLQENFGLSRGRATLLLGMVLALLGQPVILFLRWGFLDELDFWVGSFALVAFALIETVLFAWVFGIRRGWQEIRRGAAIPVPAFFYYVITYVTPLFLLAVLLFWAVQDVPGKLRMIGEPPENAPFLLGARIFMVAILAAFFWLVRRAWAQKAKPARKNLC